LDGGEYGHLFNDPSDKVIAKLSKVQVFLVVDIKQSLLVLALLYLICHFLFVKPLQFGVVKISTSLQTSLFANFFLNIFCKSQRQICYN